MLTDPKLRSQVDGLWDKLWTGGLSNPLDAIEQLSYLIFLKRLDDAENRAERQAHRRGQLYLPHTPQEMRWGHWTHFRAEDALAQAKERAAALVARGDYDGAIAVFEGVPKGFASKIVGAIVAETTAVHQAAGAKIDAAIAKAETLLAGGDSAGARAALRSIEDVNFKQGQDVVAPRVMSLLMKAEEADRAADRAEADKANAKLAALIGEFEALVKESRFTRAAEHMAALSRKPDNREMADELRAASRVAGELGRRRAAMLAAAQARIGRPVSIATDKGVRRGTLKEVSETSLVVVSQIIINGRVTGENRYEVAWSELPSDMVDEFASFARIPKPVIELADLRDAVQDSAILFRESHPGVIYALHLPEAPLMASFDRRLLTQAVTNLVKNATEALDGMGESAEAGWQARVDINVHAENGTASIEVIDNGPGLPKHNRARLLEPYVTTKGSKGTGLGLAIVQKIVEQHGGVLTLEDAPPTGGQVRGARIRISLPVPTVAGPPRTQSTRSTPPVAAPAAQGG